MTKSPMIAICLILAYVSVACNLSTSSSTSLQLTESAQDLIPTATPIIETLATETAIKTPTKFPTVIPTATTVLQGQPTAILPTISLPLVDPPGPPFDGECVARPSQAGTLVNMRRGDGLGYEAFAYLKTYVGVYGVVGDWYFVPFDGGVEAYVSSTVTKLEGDCGFLYPTPIPDRDPNRCYMDIPLASGIEVNYYDEPQTSNSQRQGTMTTLRLEIETSKSGWYKITNYQGITGWIPANMGSISGACDNIPDISPDYPICIINTVYNGMAYHTPFTSQDKFGSIHGGEALAILAKTIDNWYGFDPGIAQAGNEELDRLSWVHPIADNTFYPVGDCDAIETVYDEDADWDFVISTADDIPSEGCYIQSIAPIYTTYIFGGEFDAPEAIGVLNTYAPFVSFGDHGHVIELSDDKTGWVHQDKVRFVGDSCPT